MLATNLLAAAGSQADKTYIEDVFSVDLYTGNGATQTITNGIDLATYGGLVHTKQRNTINGGATSLGHYLCDSLVGPDYPLKTEATSGAINQGDFVTFLHDGYSLNSISGGSINYAGSPVATFVSWTFRQAPKFFKMVLVTKTAGSNATVDLSSLGTVGMVRVKRIDAAGSWYVWHRSLPAGQLLIGETTAAAATLGHITVSGTTLTLVNGVIADGQYIVHAWAHDESPDGLVQAITFTTDSSGNAFVAPGMESQCVTAKAISAVQNWVIEDSMRGLPVGGATGPQIYPNASTAETATNGSFGITAGYQSQSTSTGFFFYGSPSTSYAALAIRRGPMRVPTDPTKVFHTTLYTGDGTTATKQIGSVVTADAALVMPRASASGTMVYDRLRGPGKNLQCSNTSAESSVSVDEGVFGMSTFSVDGDAYLNSGFGYAAHFFRRAPGFFDQVCDTGTGAAHNIVHNLKSTPGMKLRKGRSGATQWELWHKALAATEKICLNSPAGKVTDTAAWNSTAPTDTVFSVGTGSTVNTNGATYVTYLFGDTAGLCKAFSYTGNGTNLDVILGFIARFIFLIRADAAGNAYLYDSVRGIVSGNDPYLLLNSTAAEVTTTDFIDPISNGFNVSGSLLNINGAQMLGWACA